VRIDRTIDCQAISNVVASSNTPSSTLLSMTAGAKKRPCGRALMAFPTSFVLVSKDGLYDLLVY
jgi:hypothetical protein